MILGSVKIFLFRLYQIGVATLIAALLARVLGSTTYGDYIFVITIISTVVIPVQFGVSQLIIRETAKPLFKEAFHYWALRIVLTWTFFGSVALTIFLFLLDNPLERQLKHLAPVAIITFCVIIAMYFFAGILAGQKRTEREQLYQNILRPTAFLVALAVILIVMGRDEITAQQTLVAYLFSVLIVVVMLLVSLRKHIWLSRKAAPVEIQMKWLWSGLYFIAIGGIDVLLQSVDILMLGTIANSEDVAVYRIGAVMAGLLSLPLSAASTHAMPRIAAAVGPEEVARMQRSCIQLARVSFAVTMLTLLSAFGLGRPVIELLFGAEYSGSFEIMLVLGVASVFNVMLGLNRLVLTSQGHERVVFRVLGWSSVINVALNAVLIMQYGAVGAAVATTVSVIVWNIWLHCECYRILGYSVAIFSRSLAASQQVNSDGS